MNKENFLRSGLLEQYALGLTDAEDSEKVEQFLEFFPELRNDLSAMQKAIEQYAEAHAVPPPPDLKSKVLSKIDDSETSDKTNPDSLPTASRFRFSLGSTAVFLALALLCASLWIQNRRFKQDVKIFQQALQAERLACDEKLKEVSERTFAFVSESETKTIVLGGTNIAPEAQAIVYWNEREKAACLNILKLPGLPNDKQYQIWADVKGEMIDMGLIEDAGESIQMVNFIADAESFNITLEPKGGSEHPTVELLQANGKVL